MNLHPPNFTGLLLTYCTSQRLKNIIITYNLKRVGVFSCSSQHYSPTQNKKVNSFYNLLWSTWFYFRFDLNLGLKLITPYFSVNDRIKRIDTFKVYIRCFLLFMFVKKHIWARFNFLFCVDFCFLKQFFLFFFRSWICLSRLLRCFKYKKNWLINRFLVYTT